MPNFVVEIINYAIQYFTSIVIQLLDMATQIMLSVFSINADGDGILASIEGYLPFMSTARGLFTAIGIGIVIFLFVFNLMRHITSNDDDLERPSFMVMRVFGASIAVYMAFTACTIIIKTCSFMYEGMWLIDSNTNNVFSSFTDLSKTMQERIAGGTTEAMLGMTVIYPFIEAIFIFAIGWNYIKLMLEIAERFVLIGFLTYSSPIAFSALGSKSTSRIFSGWLRVYFSQFLLMTMSVFFLRTFNSAVVNFIANGSSYAGEITTKTPYGNLSGATTLAFLVMLMALLIVAQKADQYMASTGMNVAQAGGGLVAEVIAVYKTTQMVGQGIGKTIGSGNGKIGNLLPIGAGQLSNAYSSVTGQGLPQSMKVMSGFATQNKDLVRMQVQSVKGASVVTAYNPNVAPKNEAGLWRNTPNGSMFIQAKGADAAEIYSPIKTPLNNANATAQKWNQDYNDALAKGFSDPKEYADQQAFNDAAKAGESDLLAGHMQEVSDNFAGIPGMQNMTITPDEKEPGKFSYAGTKENGEFVTGDIEYDNLRSGEMSIPHANMVDSAGNSFSMTEDAKIPAYGEGSLSESPRGLQEASEQITPEIARGYTDTVLNANAQGVDGYDAGFKYLSDAGVSPMAQESMEVAMQNFQYTSGGDVGSEAAEQMMNHVNLMQNGNTIDYFQNGQFPEINNNIPGKIIDLDYSKGADHHIFTTTSRDGDTYYSSRVIDADRWSKPSLSKEVTDSDGHRYYVETVQAKYERGTRTTKANFSPLKEASRRQIKDTSTQNMTRGKRRGPIIGRSK